MKKVAFLILFVFVLIPLFSFSQKPTRWRGPHQNGYYPETDLLKRWPEGGPEILWHYDNLGEGYSSPVFANYRIYISGMEGTTGFIYSLSNDGKMIWKAPYGKEFSASYPGSRSTPVIIGDFLYILSGQGYLTCLSAISGRIIWNKNILKEFEGRNIQWGITETLLIDGNKLICTPGGKQHNMIAVNRVNGELIWSVKGIGDKSAYCSPLLVEMAGRNLLVTHMADNIVGIDSDDGKLLWNYRHTNRYAVHPNTPLFHNNQLFCFSGYGKGGVMLELSTNGSTIAEKWFSETMDSRIGGAVFMNGFIYGSGDKNREWQCIDWDTGRVVYSSKEIGNGVVIAADGLLYWYSQRGELALVKPETSAFKIVGKTRVSLGSGQHWAHPVINDGKLFVRHGNVLIAYDIRE